MVKQSLTDFMDRLGPKKGFKPEPYICADSDTLTMYFEDNPSFGERINNELTVFKSFDSGDLVGFELKGILPKMKELRKMIQVAASSPRVHIKLVLMICIAENRENPEPYRGLLDKSSEFDATVPVLA